MQEGSHGVTVVNLVGGLVGTKIADELKLKISALYLVAFIEK